MRKIISLFLVLVFTCCIVSMTAADSAVLKEKPGGIAFPGLGFSFVPPEAYADTKGIVAVDGPVSISKTVDVVFCTYLAMTEEEFADFIEKTGTVIVDEVPWIYDLFTVIVIRKGMTFSEYNTYSGRRYTSAQVERTREIGKVGDTTYYLMMEDPDRALPSPSDPAYLREYRALASAGDEVASGFSFREAEAAPDPYAGLPGSKIVFSAKDLDGNEVSSADLFARNRITLLNIGATWCGACIAELADLQEIHEKMGEKGVGVVGILTDDYLDLAREEIAEYGVKYPVIWAPDNLADFIQVTSYPTSLFVGQDGTVLAEPVIGAVLSRYYTVLNDLIRKQK